MAKPDFFCIVDTETTQPKPDREKPENSIPAKVADFGAVVCNRKGEIFAQCAVMVLGIYNKPEKYPLFHLFGDDKDIWSKAGLPKRYAKYNAMLASGQRQYAGNNAINNWLNLVVGKYNPYLTAYNLPFDTDKCYNTNIDLTVFNKKFCLMASAQEKWATSKKYRQFILDNHYFKPPTDLGNMSYLTKAETMAHFITGNNAIEPHTALEDARDFELPILQALVKTTKKEVWSNPKPSSWQGRQVKDWYTPK